MSLTIALRDYLENLNSLIASLDQPISIFEIGKSIFVYLFNSTIYLFLYIFTFQWIRDIIHLPIILPTISERILQETYVLNDRSTLFNLLPVSDIESNKLFLGLFNSFFLAIPLSIPQVVSIRRWLIQGSIAGISAVVGFRLGQTLFYGAILFGLRFIMIPWLSNEPWSYLIGIVLIISLIYDMTHENLISIPRSQISRHAKIFGLHFALAWTEQSIFYQYVSNNSLGTNFSNLDVFLTANSSSFWLSHSSYVLGLLIGGLIFDILFLLAITTIVESSQVWFQIPLSTWKKQSNIWLLRISLALSFSSIPYYTLDYLFLGPLGVISQDQITNKASEKIFNNNELVVYRIGVEQEMFLDPFNRRILARNPLEGLFGTSTFETKNYEAERAWKYSDINKRSNITGVAENTKTLAKRLFNTSLIPEKALVDRKSEIIKPKPSELSKLGKNTETEFSKELDRQSFQLSNENRNPLFETRVFDHYAYPADDPFGSNLLNTISDSFPTFLNEDVRFDSRQEGIIKQKFYSNPIYKNLLSIYVDSLLKQQPEQYRTNKTNEKDLYNARLALEDYYNSLRSYGELPYKNQFESSFGGSKSFATKVYNQQYKGNLKVVRRLFGVTWEGDENPNELRKLSFDQSLYETTPTNFYHEELKTISPVKKKRNTLINPIPLYAGWDQEIRQFTLSNRYLPAEIGSRQVPYANETTVLNSNSNPYQKLSVKNQFKENFENLKSNVVKTDFTSWPVSNNLTTKELISNQNNFLFEFTDDIQKNRDLFQALQGYPETDLNKLMSKLPSSVNFLKQNPSKPILPPTRGGIFWPGENQLKFNNIRTS